MQPIIPKNFFFIEDALIDLLHIVSWKGFARYIFITAPLSNICIACQNYAPIEQQNNFYSD